MNDPASISSRAVAQLAETFDVTNPYDGSVVDSVAIADEQAIHDAVTSAGQAVSEFRYSTPAERRALLNKLSDAVRANADELANIICAEVGKTIQEARNEVRRAGNTLALSGDAATFLDGEVTHCAIVEGGVDRYAQITHRPVGIVGAITPFNYPLNLLCHKLGPAIGAGNAVVAKPSPKAPLAAQRLCELAVEVGFPKGLFQVVHGGADQAIALATSPIDLLSFTGGPSAGLALKRATGLIRTLMELGGNDPLIVMPDADLDAAVETAISQRFEIAGQSCAAVKKLYLHDDIANKFIESLHDGVAQVTAGDPSSDSTQMGPVIDPDAADLVASRIDSAVAQGAQLVAGGERNKNLIAPTVLRDVSPSSDLFAFETFGPVIATRTFGNIESAIAEVNASPFGLQAGVYTNDHQVIRQLGRELQVGGLMVNEGPDFRAEHVPFGGVKTSGLGREGVRITMREMSEPHVVID